MERNIKEEREEKEKERMQDKEKKRKRKRERERELWNKTETTMKRVRTRRFSLGANS